MTKEYDWNIILRSSLPVGLLMAFIFYTDIKIGLKWFYLVLAMVMEYGIVYYQDKKKHNIFTAMTLVLLISMITYGLKNLGFI